MLSYGYWQDQFGGDPVVGKSIEINNTSTEIVGVMPRGFRLGDTAADLIGPFRMNRAQMIPPPFCCNGIARLRDGVTLEQASADIERMLPLWLERFPFPGRGSAATREVSLATWRVAPALRPLQDDVIGGVRDVLWVVMAMIGLVLLIACANVANLLLVRGEVRAVELDVRAALGAGSWRIARALLVEHLLLAVLGGVAGLVVAYGTLQVLLALAPQRLPRLDAIALDARSLGFALLVTLAAAVVQRGAAAPRRPSSARRASARLARRERRTRATSRAEHARRRSSRAGARAARKLGSHDSNVPGIARRRARFCGARVAAAIRNTCRRSSFRRGSRLAIERNIIGALEAIPGVESAGLRILRWSSRHELGHQCRGRR
jgi:hypothetical protein